MGDLFSSSDLIDFSVANHDSVLIGKVLQELVHFFRRELFFTVIVDMLNQYFLRNGLSQLQK